MNRFAGAVILLLGWAANAARLLDGDRVMVFAAPGTGTVEEIRIRVDPPTPILERLLILRCWWDGATEPSVVAPIGDLAGRLWGQGTSGVEVAPVRYRGQLPATYTVVLDYPMPFGVGARIELEYAGGIGGIAVTTDIRVGAPRPGRFHARYQRGEWPAGEPLELFGGDGELTAVVAGTWGYPEGARIRGWGDFIPTAAPVAEPDRFGVPVVAELPLPWGATYRFPPTRRAWVLSPHADACRYVATVAWYAPAATPVVADVADLAWPTVRRRGAIEAENLAVTATVVDGELSVVTDRTGRFFLSGRRLVSLAPHSPAARFAFRLPVARAGRYRVLTRSFHGPQAASLWHAEVNGVRSEHIFQGFYAHFPGVGRAQNELDDWGVFALSPTANEIVLQPEPEYAARQAVTRFLYQIDAFLLEPLEDE